MVRFFVPVSVTLLIAIFTLDARAQAPRPAQSTPAQTVDPGRAASTVAVDVRTPAVAVDGDAGISSSGDDELDRRLPFDEPYRIPAGTAHAIGRAGRVIAVGTTVVRALESAAKAAGDVPPGDGLATLRIGPTTRLRVVDAMLSGAHEPGTSHYELLRAFTDDRTLARATADLEANGYRTHEFGDSVLIERRRKGP